MTYSGHGGYPDDTSDEALLAGIALADDRAGLVFVRRYQHRLFGLAIGIVGDARIAERPARMPWCASAPRWRSRRRRGRRERRSAP